VENTTTLGFLTGLVAFLLLVGMTAFAVSRLGRPSPLKKVNSYALTDRRAIFRRQLDRPLVEVVSVWRGQVEQVYRLEDSEGTGDVVLNVSGGYPGHGPAILEVVPEVRRVEDLARRVLVAPVSESS
jgi:hypothetical protein